MNLNKLFPRLSIRAKLGTAFVVLAVVPLAFVAAVTTQVTIRYLRETGRSVLEHDLLMARRLTEEALDRAERDVAHLARSAFDTLLMDRRPETAALAAAEAREFLSGAPGLLQVKVVGRDGSLLLIARASGIHIPSPDEAETGGRYYALRAAGLRPGTSLVLPVELRGPREAASTVPAMAVVIPLHYEDGTLKGAVVGEALASTLFRDIEESSPGFEGVTGLVDAEGRFLYHSERKRDWSSLLPTVAHDDLSADFSPAVVEAILSGAHQTLKTGDVVLSFVPMLPPHSSFSTLSLYRAIPASTLEQPVGYFRRWVFFTGVALIGVVLLLAVVAAKQFTEPILRLRDGMARLIDGTGPTALDIATNDELEDLARDFTRTAATLSEYRSRLEEALSDKTRALHRTSAELSDVLAHSADAIMALDPEGRVRIWNRGAEQLFGYSADEAVGMDADSLLLPPTGDGHDDRAFIRRELEMRGAVVNLRTRRRRRDGTIIPVSLTATVMRDESGDILGTSLIARSAEGQERLEEQMRRSERLAAASVMAAGLAHELNNPLAIIGNRLECMEQDVAENGGDQLLRQDLRVLREHTDRLRSLTRDLLRFARDEDERASEVNLNEIVRRATGLLEQSLTRAGIRLELRLDDRIPAVAAHEKAIETSYVNLLLNAADAMPSGGAVTVSTRLSADGEAVQLAVSDTGPGVPHELRERIFQPFYTTKGAGTGTGLGLAVCRAVAERHAGEIVVEDAEGGGSRFVLSLPLRSPVRLS